MVLGGPFGPGPVLLPVLVFAMIVVCPRGAHATTQEVASVVELHSALQDPSVHHVHLQPWGDWNFSSQNWPSQVLVQRSVTLTGIADAAGRPPYVDVNQMTELVVVGANGSLYQRNIFVDDCLVPVMPLLCFAVGADNGNITIDQLVLGDTSCTNIARSISTDWLLKSAYWASSTTRWAKVDDRSIHVEDTGVITGIPHGVRWRILNSTIRCTGNETHALPGKGAVEGVHVSDVQLLIATVAFFVAVLAWAYHALNRNVVVVSRNESAEVAVARSKGIVLQALIGQGTYGRVYRGQFRGQTVAIKVIEFPLGERRAAMEVTKECQHALGCQHPCVAHCLTYYTVTVRTHLRSSQLTATVLREGHGHSQQGAQDHEDHTEESPAGASHERSEQQAQQAQQHHAQICEVVPDQRQQQPPTEDGKPSSSAAGAARAAQQAAGTTAGAAPSAPATAPTAERVTLALPPSPTPLEVLGGGDSSACSSGDGTLDGVMTLLVMEYCSLGNLHSAISAGRFFLDRRSRLPNLDWVCRTALDIAEGLQHLHEVRQLCHRDVSTNNVLLQPDPSDPRRFKAKLSDFGLATVLRDCHTHKTSQLKGTVDFMPPEIFKSGEVRFAVDIYSLGIVVYWMCKGEGPFTGLAPFQVVGRKLEEVHRKEALPLPPGMTASLQQLVWDCTNSDPHARPTAAELVRRLRGIVARLGQQEEEEGEHRLPKKAASA